MADTELLIPLAEIAGVFVGFGALIAVRRGGPTEPQEVAPLRAMVSMGMLTVVAALAPVTLARFELAEQQVWALSSALVLVGFVAASVASARTLEWQAGWAAEIEATRTKPARSRLWAMPGFAFFGLYMMAMVVVPVVILLGMAPDLDAALYYALVVLTLLGAGWSLLDLVFAQRLPERA